MMCATVLKPGKTGAHGWVYRLSEDGFNWMRHHYEVTLRWALRHHRLMLLVFVMTVATTVYLFIIIPKGFFPEQDTGRISGTIQADQDISFQSMLAKLKQAAAIVGSDPEVQYVGGFTGGAEGAGRR